MKTKLNTTQRYINKLIRQRDMVNGWAKCFSCRGFFIKIHAGHYIAVGKSSYLRYCPLNIHAQCVSCNMYQSGNLIEYSHYMDVTYGSGLRSALRDVKSADGFKKWDTDDMRKLSLNEITDKYYGILLKRWENISPSEYKKWVSVNIKSEVKK